MKAMLDQFRSARLWLVAGACGLALGAVLHHDAIAQSGGSVRVVVPMAAGGPADYIARQVAERLKTVMDANVVIENKPGANGATGAAAVASSPPDGKNLLVATSGLFTITPHLDSKLSVDTQKDLTPVTLLVVNGSALLVNPKLGINNMADFVEYVKKSPQPVALGSAGTGNILHLYIELLKVATKSDNILHVPYRGIAPAMNDAVAGHIAGIFVDLPAALPQMSSGTLKAIGLVGDKRSAAAPDLPTIAEQGYPGVTGASWFGLFAPANMDKALLQKTADQVKQALSDPALIATLRKLGSEPTPTSPEEFAKIIARDREQWGRVIKERNIKPE
jgi:tripartite-type tricarboxylate transporter receptor subunit TctC